MLIYRRDPTLSQAFSFSALVLFITLSAAASATTLKPYQGDPLPDFELMDLAGEQHALSDFRGRVVLVNFWATWCPPCVKEMPSMQRLQNHLADKPFALLAVNMGEEVDVLSKFLKRIDVDFTIVVDRNGNVTRDWGLFAFPTSFLLDDKGNVSHVAYGELQWDSPAVLAIIEPMIAAAGGRRSSGDSRQFQDVRNMNDALGASQ